MSILIVLGAAFTHAIYEVFTRKLGTRDRPMTSFHLQIESRKGNIGLQKHLINLQA
ncbi:MAG: hypothetical protein GY875_25575 [Gammaproteobacteria bacterium]|nr:hypothetical protein [Gammaproteobacteria bacterium]